MSITMQSGFKAAALRRIAIPVAAVAAGIVLVSMTASAGTIQSVLAGATRCHPGTGQACSPALRPNMSDTLRPLAPVHKSLVGAYQAASPLTPAQRAHEAALRVQYGAVYGVPGTR